MTAERCADCVHLWVCSLPASVDTEICCPGFLHRDKCKEITYAKWIVPDEHYPDTCSNCLFEFVWDGDEGYKPNYCPNCGALMILGELDTKLIVEEKSNV
jgi:hypothetical protein